MTRYPGTSVINILRKEVNFCCSVSGCGSPYLTWHHFDPPWHERQHHNPDGMIALCRSHHDNADTGAFTKEQLHELKLHPNSDIAEGKFNWMRNDSLCAIGSMFIFNPYVILNI